MANSLTRVTNLLNNRPHGASRPGDSARLANDTPSLRPQWPSSAVGSGALSCDVIDMDAELSYWKKHYPNLAREAGLRYVDFEPALKLGIDAFIRTHHRSLSEMDSELSACYQRIRQGSKLDWLDARNVVEAAWRRLKLRA